MDLRLIGKMQKYKTSAYREFPGGLVVRIPDFHYYGPGSILGQGTEIPQAARCGQKKKKENFCK